MSPENPSEKSIGRSSSRESASGDNIRFAAINLAVLFPLGALLLAAALDTDLSSTGGSVSIVRLINPISRLLLGAGFLLLLSAFASLLPLISRSRHWASLLAISAILTLYLCLSVGNRSRAMVSRAFDRPVHLASYGPSPEDEEETTIEIWLVSGGSSLSIFLTDSDLPFGLTSIASEVAAEVTLTKQGVRIIYPHPRTGHPKLAHHLFGGTIEEASEGGYAISITGTDASNVGHRLLQDIESALGDGSGWTGLPR